MPVSQDINALPAQSQRDGIGIHTEIVIAEYREHTVTRPKPPKEFRSRFDIPPGIRNEISSERNNVRIQPVRLPHSFGKQFFGEKETVVDVGNLHYAQAVKRAREGVQPDALIVDGESITGTPSCGVLQRVAPRVVFNTAPAPSAKPPREFFTGSRIPRNRKCKAVPHHPSVNKVQCS
jgi:hypothetical protein